MAKDPSGAQINSLKQHIQNLLSPSTPFFFNTLYDPYAQGTDFVRGYPFSLREGAPTAVSHGEPDSLFPSPNYHTIMALRIIDVLAGFAKLMSRWVLHVLANETIWPDQ